MPWRKTPEAILRWSKDPAVIAARQHLRRSAPGTATTALIDIALAAAMLGYNYAATRYVVRVASADVVEHTRGDKIIVFKKKRRKNYRRKKGHRQDLTVLKITAIAR